MLYRCYFITYKYDGFNSARLDYSIYKIYATLYHQVEFA